MTSIVRGSVSEILMRFSGLHRIDTRPTSDSSLARSASDQIVGLFSPVLRALLFPSFCRYRGYLELLGHASISITMDTHSHVLPGMDDGLADMMEEALG